MGLKGRGWRTAVFACAIGATEVDLPQPAAWRSLFLLLDEARVAFPMSYTMLYLGYMTM